MLKIGEDGICVRGDCGGRCVFSWRFIHSQVYDDDGMYV